MASNPLSSGFNYLEEDQVGLFQPSLDGFDELWQVGIGYPVQERTQIEELIDYQREQIYLLSDETNHLKSENHLLRQELADLAQKTEIYAQMCKDYVSLIELNRALTKQLNLVMSRCENEVAKLKAIRSLLG
ncbi:MAG: hypothetical protein SFT81_05135 [Candidatus Caenarcaniphilales bacterium]|nr:hypothetical protein [Candidatus Caenarcaniphilales bacterium]